MAHTPPPPAFAADAADTPHDLPPIDPPKERRKAVFLEGPTWRHIVVMTATSAFGLLAIFATELADIYFLSLLGDTAVTAAVGYAGSILFFTVSIGIGLMIAASALVARAVGAGDWAAARRLASHAMILSGLAAAVMAVMVWLLVPHALALLGAEGRTHALATSYLRIIVPSMPILIIGMVGAGLLRAVGDAKRGMYTTLIAGVVNAMLDPFLIFTLGLGIEGAAIATVLGRLAMVGVALYAVIRIHDLAQRTSVPRAFGDARPVFAIATPAILTNIATPIGNAYITAALAGFGDGAVAGWAIIGRIMPVAFAAIFALSGAVGPIIGQNAGALNKPRVRATLDNAFVFSAMCVGVAWTILALAHPYISATFNADPEAASLIRAFCLWQAPGFIFFGLLFVANAAFNNLGKPHYSTMFNWARATLGTVPFVWAGGALLGAEGVLAGNMAGALVFGVAAAVVSYRLADRIPTGPAQ